MTVKKSKNKINVFLLIIALMGIIYVLADFIIPDKNNPGEYGKTHTNPGVRQPCDKINQAIMDNWEAWCKDICPEGELVEAPKWQNMCIYDCKCPDEDSGPKPKPDEPEKPEPDVPEPERPEEPIG